MPTTKLYTGDATVKLSRGPDNQQLLDDQGQPIFEVTVDLPFVTLERMGNAETTRTSSGTILEAVQVRFDCWTDDLDKGKAIMREVRDRFNRADFNYSQGRVLDCKSNGQSETKDNAGVWHIAQDWLIRTEEQG